MTQITRRQIREGAADALGIFFPVTADDVNTIDHTIRIADVLTKLPDGYSLMDSFIMSRAVAAAGNTYRRIVKAWLVDTPDKVQLDGGPDFADGALAGLYLLLSPEDWNNCINMALEELYRIREVSITLDTADNDYAVTTEVLDPDSEPTGASFCSWLTSRTQILGLEVKTGTGITNREFWPGVRYIEDNGNLTVHLTYVPNSTDATLILKTRKPYVWRDNLLSTDQSTTKCPYMLAIYAVCCKAIERLFARHGKDEMRKNFGQAIVLAEKELARQKQLYMPAIRPQSYEVDEGFEPDIPGVMMNWRW